MRKISILAAVGVTVGTLVMGVGLVTGEQGGGAATREAATQAAGMPAAGEGKYLYEDKLRPGMKGYGLTVMKGGKIERFEIEIIDVIKNFAPGTNAILVRCAGLGLEHSGIIAGMSGSPVYVDGKMIGAIAFGWGASKDPIAGVQPIRQMLRIPVKDGGDAGGVQQAGTWGGTGRWGKTDRGLGKLAQTSPGWKTLATHLAAAGGSGHAEAPAGDLRHANWVADKRAASLRPLSSPLMVSGVSPAGMSLLEDVFAQSGLTVVQAGGAGGSIQKEGGLLGGVAEVKAGEIALAPGSSIAIPLLRGDMDMSAIGTVTEVDGKRVWAFGHALLAEGPTELPIATGYVYTTLPSLLQSFKLGASVEEAGVLVADEQSGIVGVMGRKARTVPIQMSVKSADGGIDRTYQYELAQHPRFSAEVLGAALYGTLTAQRDLPAKFTAQVKGELLFETPGGEGVAVKIDTLGTHGEFSMLDVIMPVAVLTDNPLGVLKMKGVKVETRIMPEVRAAQIKEIKVDRTAVAPGEKVRATVTLKPYQAQERTVALELAVPEDTPDGSYELVVGDGRMAMMQEVMAYPYRFAPEDAKALAATVQRVAGYRSDTVYARLVLEVTGAAKGSKAMRNLPASRVAMMASEKRSDTAPVYASVEAAVGVDAVVEGGERFTIRVDKDAGKRFFEADRGRGRMLRGGGMPVGPTMPGTQMGRFEEE